MKKSFLAFGSMALASINLDGDFFDIIQGGNFSSFDAGNFDVSNMEEIEDFNRMKKVIRQNPNGAAKAMVAMKNAIANNPTGGIQGAGMGNAAMKGSKLSGVFKLAIKRLSANIAADLPVPLFGYLDSLTNYTKVINQQLPSGVTIGAFQNGQIVNSADSTKFAAFLAASFAKAETVRLAYAQGSAIDIVEISCEQNPYPILLQSTFTDFMLINGIRFKINDSSQYDQLSASINPYRRTSLGKTTNDSTSLDTFFSPNQFQPGIVDYEVNSTVDKETTLTFNLIQAVVTLNASVFVNSREAWNAIKTAAKVSR